jgi:mRNA interferase MazF
MAITSQLQAGMLADNVTITDWKGAGLLKASVIKLIISTSEKGLVLKKLGRLQDADREALKGALQLFLGE